MRTKTHKALSWIKITLCSLMIAAAIVIFSLFLVNYFSSKATIREAAYAETLSFATLAKVTSPTDARASVGDLGVFLELKSGNWIAIRYNDSHRPRWWSSAVALDSQGGWYISNVHFCGRFLAYPRYRYDKINGKIPIFDKFLEELWAIEQSSDISSVKESMINLGFQSVHPPLH